MPSCVNCSRYDSNEQICTVVGGSPIRKCVIAILDEECPTYKGRVLEIGCGGWDYAKRLCESSGCEWYGVDPMIVDTKGRRSIATKQGTVTDIPYGNQYFDVVLGVQSFEHWPEFKSTYEDGLREIFRVLKPGGLLSLNFPIHFHGHPMFINGDLDTIRSLFPTTDWDVTIEPWRQQHEPLPVFRGWRTCGFSDEAVGQGTSSWIAQLHAIKKVNPSGDGSSPDVAIKEQLTQMKAARAPFFYHERLVPHTPRWNTRWPEHHARYEWVALEVEAAFGTLEGCNILEVGCGVGAGAKLLADRGAQVVAVDYADQALQIARDDFSHPNVRLVQDDGERLTTIDDSFDVVIVFDVLERVHRPEKLLRRCNELLRPSGLLFCSTPNTEQFPKLPDGVTPQNPFHIHEYNLSAFRNLVGEVLPQTSIFYQTFAPHFQARQETYKHQIAREKTPVQRILRKLHRIFGRQVATSPDTPLPEKSDIVISPVQTRARHFIARCTKEE